MPIETPTTMFSSRHAVSAVLIAGMQTPLRADKSYVFQWVGGTALGHIRSVKQRLQSAFVTSSLEAMLRPRELASVEIEILSSELSTRQTNCVQQLAIVEPSSQETVGTGLLLPDGTHNEGGSHAPCASLGLTVWLTGLSGAGKSTIALQVYDRLHSRCSVEMLDGDVIRTYLCRDLGYSKEDRDENVRRLGFVADLLTRRGLIVLITAIAPYRATRDEVRKNIGRFVEVYVNASVAVCEQRDVKGLYKRARAGEIRSFTGIDDPYEAPLAPEVECHTDIESIEASVSKVIAAIEQELKRDLGPTTKGK